MLVYKLKVKLCDLLLAHAENAPSIVSYASELTEVKPVALSIIGLDHLLQMIAIGHHAHRTI